MKLQSCIRRLTNVTEAKVNEMMHVDFISHNCMTKTRYEQIRIIVGEHGKCEPYILQNIIL